ncbi:MAG: preprotein translocase subunit YajC [candidate division KSB1 bacterium]|nr:preprotein translocase subunit YajC [candidate division KSB1 bacterium]
MLAFVFLFGGQPGQSNSLWGFMFPMILIFAIMYFLILRPQAKRQKEHQKMLASLEKGDRIMTAGGIFGSIVGIKEKENILIVKVAENVKLEVSRNHVSRKLDDQKEKEG